MNAVATFEKVSFEQWTADCEDALKDCARVRSIYRNIKLPTRATTGSAGYDFYVPYDISLKPGESVRIATGIKCAIQEGYVLMTFPRSSLGYKYKLTLDNTVGIIDADYYGNEANDGDIFQQLTNNGTETVVLSAGTKFCQGVFVPFGITTDDDAEAVRAGGVGSTGA